MLRGWRLTNWKRVEMDADAASPFVKHIEQSVCSRNLSGEVGLPQLLLLPGAVVDRLCQDISDLGSHVPNIHHLLCDFGVSGYDR